MAENKNRSPLDLWDDKTENATKADIFSFTPPYPLRHTGERSYTISCEKISLSISKSCAHTKE